MRELWEILVPTVRNNGKPIHTRFYRVWDQKVYQITGGLTIMTPAKGKWVAPDGKLFAERMIPVRIVATRDQIDRIIDMTLEYYDQLAVLAYRVSDDVIMRHRSAYVQPKLPVVEQVLPSEMLDRMVTEATLSELICLQRTWEQHASELSRACRHELSGYDKEWIASFAEANNRLTFLIETCRKQLSL